MKPILLPGPATPVIPDFLILIVIGSPLEEGGKEEIK